MDLAESIKTLQELGLQEVTDPKSWHWMVDEKTGWFTHRSQPASGEHIRFVREKLKNQPEKQQLLDTALSTLAEEWKTSRKLSSEESEAAKAIRLLLTQFAGFNLPTELNLRPIKPLKRQFQGRRLTNLFLETNLQFRMMSDALMTDVLFHGIRSNYLPDVTAILESESTYGALKQWISSRRGVLEKDRRWQRRFNCEATPEGEVDNPETPLSHDANVNYPTGVLRVFRDYLQTGKTDRIYYSDDARKEAYLKFSIAMSIEILVTHNRIDHTTGEKLYSDLLNIQRSFTETPAHFSFDFGSLDLGSIKFEPRDLLKKMLNEKAEIQTPRGSEPVIAAILDHLEEEMIRMNKEFFILCRYSTYHPFARAQVVLSTPNLLTSYHEDYPFQATIIGSRVPRKNILGIALLNSTSRTKRCWACNGSFIKDCQEFQENPLKLVLSTDHYYGFIVAVKHAGCTQETLQYLNNVRNVGRGEYDTTTMESNLSPNVFTALQTAAREYLANFKEYYEAKDAVEGILSFAAATGLPIYDAETGNPIV